MISVSQFRLATVNIHSFCDSNWQSNVHGLAQLFQPLSLDIVALQEVVYSPEPSHTIPDTYSHLQLLSKLLQLPYVYFGAASYTFGNAVLSRYPFRTTSNHQLSNIEHSEKRAVLAVKCEDQFSKDNDATIYVTHLDHMNEQFRLAQINELEKYIQSSDGFQLIVGDFNSLTFDDYSNEYFDTNIRKVRAQCSWESPYNLVTNKMKENGYWDCWREMNKDAINEQVVTCDYGTRIDYIWRRGELKNGWPMDECRIFSTQNLTDHNGVLITFSKGCQASAMNIMKKKF